MSGYTATQHLSPNHLIEFDDRDPDRAICTSYMYAQHDVDAAGTGEFLLLFDEMSICPTALMAHR